MHPSWLVGSQEMVLFGLWNLVSFGVDVETAVDAGLLVALDVAFVVRSGIGSGIWLLVHRVAQVARVLLSAVLEAARRWFSFDLGVLRQILL